MFVTGASGNGKSTLGRALAERLGVPYTELDALHWGADWTEASAGELRARVEAVLAASDGWVIDGGYRGKLGDLLWERADTVVWLDQPLPLIMGRLWRRTYGRIRTERGALERQPRELAERLLGLERALSLDGARPLPPPARVPGADGALQRGSAQVAAGGAGVSGRRRRDRNSATHASTRRPSQIGVSTT